MGCEPATFHLNLCYCQMVNIFLQLRELTESKGEGSIPGHDVVSFDVDQHQVDLLAQLDGIIAVLQDLDLTLGRDLAHLLTPEKRIIGCLGLFF